MRNRAEIQASIDNGYEHSLGRPVRGSAFDLVIQDTQDLLDLVEEQEKWLEGFQRATKALICQLDDAAIRAWDGP